MSPRGCLVSIIAFVAVVTGVLWFVLPPVVGGLAAAALSAAGVHGVDTHVDVSADPPLRLLFLDADRVRVRSTMVEIRNVRANSIDVTLRDVSIGGRRFAYVEGGLTGVTVTPDQGPPLEAQRVQIVGPAIAAHVDMTMDRPALGTLVASAISPSGRITVSQVALEAPDRITATTSRGPITGRLAVNAAGDLVLLRSLGGSLSLVGTGADQPVRLQSVQVAGDELELGGTIDLTQ